MASQAGFRAPREPHFEQCASHGTYQASMIDAIGTERFLPGCPMCKRENEAKAVLQRAAIPPRFRDRTFAHFQARSGPQHRALEVAESYAEGFKSTFLPSGTSLMFVGKPGTGKTHLACAILHALVSQDVFGTYCTVPDALRRIKDTWSRSSTEHERDALRRFTRPDLLVLDEVGVQFGSEAERLILFEIINGRYELVKPTIVVSNLDRKGVEENLGYRCVDRLSEGGGQCVVFDWESHRRAAG